MAIKSWTITDVEKNVYLDSLAVSQKDVDGSATGYSVEKTTLRGGLSDGVDTIRVRCGDLSFVILPSRGMGLWKAWLGENEYGWKSPVRGPVHPQFVDQGEPSGLGWLDGFDELLVRCGLESNGAPQSDDNGVLQFPLHGRIANRPAQKVEVSIDGDAGEVTVRGVVEETRFHFFKLRMSSTFTAKVGKRSIAIHDEIENLSSSPAEAQILYHTNFGAPVLDEGAKVVAPVKTLVPRNERAADGITKWNVYEGPTPGFEEQVYFFELLSDKDGRTQALLRNSHGWLGTTIHFNTGQLPCFTTWKNTTALSDGYVTGIEPGVNFPNPRSFEGEQGRVVKLPPLGKQSFDITLELHNTAEQVAAAEKAIQSLQGDHKPTVFEKPQKGWCA